MGFLKELKYLIDCQVTGRRDEYKDYIGEIKRCKFQIRNDKQALSNVTRHFENVAREFKPDSREYGQAYYDVQRWMENLHRSTRQLQFMRPNIASDIAYRDDIVKKYVLQLNSVVPLNSNLRFHGTPIYYAEEIIKSGEISSTMDRLGYMRSSNLNGRISVYTANKLSEFDMSMYWDMASYGSCLPGGCVFVLLPKDDAEASLIRSNEMNNVNFKNNPNQLVGILTTPENIERVQGWMIDSGLDFNKVYTFEKFLSVAQQIHRTTEQSDSAVTTRLDTIQTMEVGKINVRVREENTEELEKGDREI